MHRKILLWGIGLALVAVILGAFGAHALKAILSPEKLQSYETGVRYQLIHALALISLAIYGQHYTSSTVVNKSLGLAAVFLLWVVFCSVALFTA